MSNVNLGKWREGFRKAKYVQHQYNYDPDDRSKELDAASAWNEMIIKWTGTDEDRLSWNSHRIEVLCLEIRTNTNGTRSAGDSWSKHDSSIPVTTQVLRIERRLLYMMR